MRYFDAEKSSWLEWGRQAVHRGVRPRSVHFPLNTPYSSGLVYCDCAFNLYRLPVPPDMSSDDPDTMETRDRIRPEMLSFAFGDPAFVPEFRQTVWNRISGCLPAAHGGFFAWLLRYDLEYCTDPETGLVYVKVGITNLDDRERGAVFRCIASRPLEKDVFDYHYRPFRWDAARFAAMPPDGRKPEIAANEGFSVDPDNAFAFRAEEYDAGFGCSSPYVVSPAMQLREGRGMMRFARTLRPGETASVTLAVRFDGVPEAAPETDLARVVEKSRKFWGSQLGDTRAEFGTPEETDVFCALQWNSLQLLLELDSPKYGRICQPCQGGSSERFYVWVWEAMQSLRPMLALGHFAPVRKVLDFIFSLQDGGCPPRGRFHSLAGAVGTTGPRWASATGAALLLASDFAMLSPDRDDFLAGSLPKMLRAANWILNEIRATRRYKPDGTKELGFGVMPFACATDGDEGYIIASTDAWSFAGLERFAQFLKEIDAPEYTEVAGELEQYRRDLSAAIDSVRRADGFIDRKLTAEGRIARAFDVIGGAIQFLETGFADPREERFARYLAYMEKNAFQDRFCGPLFDRIHYIGNSENTMFCACLKLRQWKKACLAAETFRQCGMTPDLYLTQERYSEADDAFTPWQPNASNNGRFLDMAIKRLFFADGENEIVLAGGLSPFDVTPGRTYMLEKLHTVRGLVGLRLGGGGFVLTRSEPFPAGTRFVFPDHFRFDCRTPGVRALPGNTFELTRSAGELAGGLAVIPEKLL